MSRDRRRIGMNKNGKSEANNSGRGPVRAGLFLPAVGVGELSGCEGFRERI
jgi:hypothetical protein